MSNRDDSNDQSSGYAERPPDTDINVVNYKTISQVIEAAVADPPVEWVNVTREIRNLTGLSLRESFRAVQSYRKNVLGESLCLKPSSWVLIAISLLTIATTTMVLITGNPAYLLAGSLLSILVSCLSIYLNIPRYRKWRKKRRRDGGS